MDEFEKVEKLREKANVSYEEAKQALETNNWDMLDSMVWLEKQGKVKGPEQSSYNTNNNQQNSEAFHKEFVKQEKEDGFGDALGRFFAWCGKVIKMGMDNFFVIERYNDAPVNMPILVFVVLLMAAFWVVVPLLIIGLFFSFRYSFRGPDIKNNGVNDALNKAAKGAEEFKEDVKNGSSK